MIRIIQLKTKIFSNISFENDTESLIECKTSFNRVFNSPASGHGRSAMELLSWPLHSTCRGRLWFLWPHLSDLSCLQKSSSIFIASSTLLNTAYDDFVLLWQSVSKSWKKSYFFKTNWAGPGINGWQWTGFMDKDRRWSVWSFTYKQFLQCCIVKLNFCKYFWIEIRFMRTIGHCILHFVWCRQQTCT